MAKSSKRRTPTALVFEKRNYTFLLLGISLIVIGFVAMYVEGEFLGPISLNVSPLLILGGYAGVIYAILWRSDEEAEQNEASLDTPS